MKLDAVAQTLLESVIRRLNIAPVPLMHTHTAMLLSRVVIEASRAGVFAAASERPVTAAEIARRCGLHEVATAKLVDALAASGYFRVTRRSPSRTGHRADVRYALTPMARKWMLPSSPQSVHDKMLFQFFETDFVNRMGEYLRTGRSVVGGLHASSSPDFWRIYQRAMRSIASISAGEIGRRAYVPQGARAMLDLGGSHGLYSVVLCRRHPRLSSTILDLPAAVEQAAPLLARERMGERVRYREGDALQVDLGASAYDVVLVASLLHHFDDATNRTLMRKIARALRPGGAVVVQELVRCESPAEGGQPAALLDLYFALASEAGAYAVADIVGWQRDAGLVPRRVIRLRTMPLGVLQTAVKPTV